MLKGGIMNGNKNVFDNFLEKYDEYSSKKKVNVETYYRPSKVKCIFGFIFCLIFMLILIRIFAFNMVFLFIFVGDLLCLVYFGLNLFTKKGFAIKQKFSVPEDYLVQEEEIEENEEYYDDIKNNDDNE